MTFLLIFGVHRGFTPSDVLLAPAAAPAFLALSLLLLYQLPLQSPQYSSRDFWNQHPDSRCPPLFSLHYARCDVEQAAGCAGVGRRAGGQARGGLGMVVRLVLADELVVGLDVLELLCWGARAPVVPPCPTPSLAPAIRQCQQACWQERHLVAWENPVLMFQVHPRDL